MDISRSLRSLALPAGSTCAALGLFSGLHLGHMAVINQMLALAKAGGLKPLVFTFTAERHAPAAKGSMTGLLSFEQMCALLSQAGVGQIVCPEFDEFCALTPERFVREVLYTRLGVAGVVCGFDYRFGKDALGDTNSLRALCARLGIAAEVVPAVLVDGQPAASRRIRALVESGEIPAANRLLGRHFAIDFEVVRGRQLGRTLGLPTINQVFPPGFTLPRFGVYATRSCLGGKIYSSVTNVGVKPTVGSEAVLAETYIQDFSGDLYGERVNVEFVQFLRPEQTFPDLCALKAAISADAAQAKAIISASL